MVWTSQTIARIWWKSGGTHGCPCALPPMTPKVFASTRRQLHKGGRNSLTARAAYFLRVKLISIVFISPLPRSSKNSKVRWFASVSLMTWRPLTFVPGIISISEM